jgi:hypothetical protein
MRFFRPRPPDSGPRPLVVVGSSTSELFDYVFGDNPDYYPFWASGWRARALLAAPDREYLGTILAPVDRRARIILNLGKVDINYNAAHRAAKYGEFDLPGFLDEVRDGILAAAARAHALGFKEVHAAFLAPPTDVAAETWRRVGVEHQFAPLMRGRMYVQLAREVAKKMPTINTIAAFSAAPDYPVLAPEFHRLRPDAHPHFIQMQEIVWQALRPLPGMLPRRDPPHRALYPHKGYFYADLKKQGTTRPRTCR